MLKDIGFFAPLLYGYIFFGVFWGWHYGGKVWLGISKVLDTLFQGIPLIGPVLLLVIRYMIAAIIGVFGGGIYQFNRCRDIVRRSAAATTPKPA